MLQVKYGIWYSLVVNTLPVSKLVLYRKFVSTVQYGCKYVFILTVTFVCTPLYNYLATKRGTPDIQTYRYRYLQLNNCSEGQKHIGVGILLEGRLKHANTRVQIHLDELKFICEYSKMWLMHLGLFHLCTRLWILCLFVIINMIIIHKYPRCTQMMSQSPNNIKW